VASLRQVRLSLVQVVASLLDAPRLLVQSVDVLGGFQRVEIQSDELAAQGLDAVGGGHPATTGVESHHVVEEVRLVLRVAVVLVAGQAPDKVGTVVEGAKHQAGREADGVGGVGHTDIIHTLSRTTQGLP
jgi:hypothetical protein